MRNWLCLVVWLLGSRARTRTLEQRQVRATNSAALLLLGASRPTAKLLLYPAGPIRRILRIRPSAVLATNRKPLIPFGFHEIWFVW